jgi:hypothetical protein
MVVDAVHTIKAPFSSMNHGYDSVSQLLGQSMHHGIVVAQTLKDPDLLGNIQATFQNFIQSGQIWALLIGLVLGYMIRGFTTYG